MDMIVDICTMGGFVLSLWLIFRTGRIQRAVDKSFTDFQYKGQRQLILEKLKAIRTFLSSSNPGDNLTQSCDLLLDMIIRIEKMDTTIKRKERKLLSDMRSRVIEKPQLEYTDIRFIISGLSDIIVKLELEEK